MDFRRIKLTICTLTTSILGVITIMYEKYIQGLVEITGSQYMTSFTLLYITIIFTCISGFYYLKTSFSYSGFDAFLCGVIGIGHVVAMVLGLIALLKIDFGESWLGMLILAILFIILVAHYANKNFNESKE